MILKKTLILFAVISITLLTITEILSIKTVKVEAVEVKVEDISNKVKETSEVQHRSSGVRLKNKENIKIISSSTINYLSEKYSVDEVLVTKIIECESEFSLDAIGENVDKDGNVWSRDYGGLQVNDYYHKDDMAKIGMNIYNGNDSLEYGFMLLKRDGLTHWKWSRSCWNK